MRKHNPATSARMRQTRFNTAFFAARADVYRKIKENYFYDAKYPKWTLSHRDKSQYYFDTRHLLLDWRHTHNVSHLFRYRLLLDYPDKDLFDAFIGGLETGAIL